MNEENQTHQFRPFAAIPFAYLRWNEGAVRLREVKAGDVLCKQGEFGSTAFLLKEGKFDIWVTPKPQSTTGLLGRLLSRGGRDRANQGVHGIPPAAT